MADPHRPDESGFDVEPAAALGAKIDWDLLEPSLSARDDFVGFQRPFNPWMVLVVAVISRPMVGSWLLAYNAWQLGLKRQVVALVAGGFLAAVVVFSVYFMVIDGKEADDGSGQLAELFRFLLNLSSALVGLACFRSHRRRYRLYLLCDGQPRSLWVVGALTIVLSLFFLNGILYAVVASLVAWVMGGGS